MEKDKIRYILNYHSGLMTKEEQIAWRHWSTTYKMEQSDSTPEQIERRKKLSLKRGWITDDKDILELLKGGIDQFERKATERIINDNSIEFNNCPKCGELTRTPNAKQCRFCGHNWH